MQKSLYLIPVPLDEESSIEANIPNEAINIVRELQYFIVENEKTARAFLKKYGILTPQKDLQIMVYDKRDKLSISHYFKFFKETDQVGLMSEAGCPGVADPGAEIVAEAHKKNYNVIPFIGPSSILLALMASGFNGQQFCFHGYIPIDKADRIKRIKDLEAQSFRFRQTQIFIETPFRNNHLFDDIIKNCKPSTQLCVAANINAEDQLIKTRSIADWKDHKPELHKIPVVFILYATS
jgi:16S rRNA (cytidine1402-2'-O)-methyltransferase